MQRVDGMSEGSDEASRDETSITRHPDQREFYLSLYSGLSIPRLCISLYPIINVNCE